jgi:hypothetical protein
MVALDNLHMCPDCSSSLAACHAQSTAECPEPTRAAVRLLRILWSMAVQYKDPNLFFNHYPDVHATDQAWALSADAIWSTFEEKGLPTEDLQGLLLTYATDIDQYSVISSDADDLILVRMLGGRRTIMREEVDEDLIRDYDEAQAALASPRKRKREPPEGQSTRKAPLRREGPRALHEAETSQQSSAP